MRSMKPACAAFLISAAATDLVAQCPDGSPPPCATPAVQAARAARAVVPAAAERARRFLILPFRNVTRREEQAWLVEGSTTMLSDALSRWEGITVVADEKLYPALKRAGIGAGQVAEAPRVRRVAEETGGWTAVTGEVLATGGSVRVTARAWDVPTSREVVRAHAEVPADGDVRLAFDSISLRLLRSVGLESVNADLAGATTRDLDAYRAYLRGLAHERRAEVKGALDAYKEAIRRDSSFALAWARLAEMTYSADPASIFNPTSESARYSARAVALSAKLPPRKRALVQASAHMFSAQFAQARRVLEELVAQDSGDVEALAAFGALEMFDPFMVPVPGGSRPRGSYNRAALLAKRVSELDPTRHDMFARLATIYAAAGVPGATPTLGVDRETNSFAELIQLAQQREHIRFYIPVYEDTIRLVPAESVSVIPRDSLKAMRRRARAVAKSWGQRWVTSAADAAAPRQLMSELYSYDGDYAAALRELAAAESLGVQQPTWSPPARRLVFTAKSGDYSAAGRMADSLTAAGYFASPSNFIVAGDAAMWAFALHLLRARVTDARTLHQQQTAIRKMITPGMPGPQFIALMSVMGNEDPEEEPGISRRFRGMQLDSILKNIRAFVHEGEVRPWLPLLLPMLAEVADTTKGRLSALVPVADTIASLGFDTVAFQLAGSAVAADTTLGPEAAKYEWYRKGADALNGIRRAIQSRFTPDSAIVTADRAVFQWKVDDSKPFMRNHSEIPPGLGEYGWEVTVELDGRYYELWASSRRKSPEFTPASGTLAEILIPTAQRSVRAGRAEGGIHADTTLLPNVQLRTEIAPGVLRMIVTDKGLVNELRAVRPARARFVFRPCVRAVGVIANPECVEAWVPVTYP